MLQKGTKASSCSDAMAINITSNRFCIADGVSQSHLSGVTARKMCHVFVDENILADDNWDEDVKHKVLPLLAEHWNKAVEEHELRFFGLDLDDARQVREVKPAGSSTFAGLTIDSKKRCIRYHILGDSTLFYRGDDEYFTGICSCQTMTDSNNVKRIVYDNFPKCITSTTSNCIGKVKMTFLGNWINGDLPLADSAIALMTDGAAAWFQEETIKKERAFERLWNITDQNSFITFAKECRSKGMMCDDIAIILFKISEQKGTKGGVIIYDEVYRGDLELLKLQGNPQTPEFNLLPNEKQTTHELPKPTTLRDAEIYDRENLVKVDSPIFDTVTSQKGNNIPPTSVHQRKYKKWLKWKMMVRFHIAMRSLFCKKRLNLNKKNS